MLFLCARRQSTAGQARQQDLLFSSPFSFSLFSCLAAETSGRCAQESVLLLACLRRGACWLARYAGVWQSPSSCSCPSLPPPCSAVLCLLAASQCLIVALIRRSSDLPCSLFFLFFLFFIPRFSLLALCLLSHFFSLASSSLPGLALFRFLPCSLACIPWQRAQHGAHGL